MGENLLDHHGVFYAGDNPESATAGLTGRDVNVEHPLEPLRPGHRGATFGGRWRFIPSLGLVALASLGRGDQGTVFAVRGKYTMKSCQIHPWFWHQGRQPGDEVQWLENDMGGAIPVGRLELVANVAIRRER